MTGESDVGKVQSWLEQWGEAEVISKLATKPDVDEQGKSHGLKILSSPEIGTPLNASHGIMTGDIIRSINDEPVGSKEDVLNYLRGKGKGLDRYEVVIENNGNERKVVYRVPKPSRRSPRD